MEKGIKKIVFSKIFYEDLKSIYLYGVETFGEIMAEILQDQILNAVILKLKHKFKETLF